MALYINGQEVSGGSGASSLEDLTDVNITTPTNGQTLVYDSANSKWVNSGNTIGGSPLVTYKVTLSSSQYGWFTFVDENGNNLNVKNGVPIMASCLTNSKYYHALVWEYNTSGDFIFKVADINGNYTPIGSSLSNIEFDCAYIKTNMASNIYTPIIYSDEEREIGVWRDGKPLYEKVLDLGSDTQISYNSWTQTSINLTSIDRLIFISGLNSVGTAFYGDLMGGDNNGILQLQTSRNGTYVSVRYLIFRYTKSTDTAGSGQWTPQGVPSHHYSIDEKVVGTWIDGSTIYEKTIYVPTLSISSSGTVNQTIEANFVGNNLISVSGYKASSENSIIYSIPDGRLRVFIDDQANLKLEAINSGSWTGYAYVTIRYTKSTD